MTYDGIVRGTYRKFFIPTAISTMSIAVMNLLNILFAGLFFGNGGNLHFKFAGPAVKTEKSISRSQFHDIGKVMAPALVQIQFPSAVQRRFNI